MECFENPYRDAKKAKEVTTAREDWEEAEKVHRQSVVLLKNDSTLPLTKEKLAGEKRCTLRHSKKMLQKLNRLQKH